MSNNYQVMFVVVNNDIHAFDDQTQQLDQPQRFFEDRFNLSAEQMMHLVCGIMTEDGILLLGPAHDSAPNLIDTPSVLLYRLIGIYHGYFLEHESAVAIRGGRVLSRVTSRKIPGFLFTPVDGKGFPNIALSPARLEECGTTSVMHKSSTVEDLEWTTEDLWGADPECKHHVISASGGGVRCTKCGGWCCF